MNTLLKTIRLIIIIVVGFFEGVLLLFGTLLGIVGVLLLVALAFALCLLPLLPFILS